MQSLLTPGRTPPGPARCLALGLLCALVLLLHATQAMAGGHAEAPMIHQTDIPMPMRDGVLLRADIWRPAGPGPFPALICRTPYGKDTDRDELRFARSAVARGYAVVIQDVRGRFASGGEFEPHRNEGRDGYDSIESDGTSGPDQQDQQRQDRGEDRSVDEEMGESQGGALIYAFLALSRKACVQTPRRRSSHEGAGPQSRPIRLSGDFQKTVLARR